MTRTLTDELRARAAACRASALAIEPRIARAVRLGLALGVENALRDTKAGALRNADFYEALLARLDALERVAAASAEYVAARLGSRPELGGRYWSERRIAAWDRLREAATAEARKEGATE